MWVAFMDTAPDNYASKQTLYKPKVCINSGKQKIANTTTNLWDKIPVVHVHVHVHMLCVEELTWSKFSDILRSFLQDTPTNQNQ